FAAVGEVESAHPADWDAVLVDVHPRPVPQDRGAGRKVVVVDPAAEPDWRRLDDRRGRRRLDSCGLRSRPRGVPGQLEDPVLDGELARLVAVVDAEQLERVEDAAAGAAGEALVRAGAQMHSRGRVPVLVAADEAPGRRPPVSEVGQPDAEPAVEASYVG